MKQTSQELLDFVEKALSRNIQKEKIESILLQAGWPKDQVDNVLDSFADLDFPIPVPKPRYAHTARETFMYLLMFTALFIFAINLGSALFYLIEKALPDDPTYGPHVSQIRWAVSLMIVSLPIFVFVSRRINRGVLEIPEKRRSKIRRWLTYLTLFIAASVIIGDSASLIYNFLSGELTLRFILKVLTIGAISGIAFSYYLQQLRRDEQEE